MSKNKKKSRENSATWHVSFKWETIGNLVLVYQVLGLRLPQSKNGIITDAIKVFLKAMQKQTGLQHQEMTPEEAKKLISEAIGQRFDIGLLEDVESTDPEEHLTELAEKKFESLDQENDKNE